MLSIGLGKREIADEDAVRLAKGLLSRYKRSHNLVRSFESVCSGDENLKRLAFRLMMHGELSERDLENIKNKNMRELVRIIAIGVEKGADVENAVDSFAKRLSQRIANGNRIKSKVSGARALIYMGMSVFFPLFSGISALIISGSLGVVDKDASLAYRSFLIVTAAYVPLVLYLTSAFSHPEKPFVQNLLSILPYFLVAMSIMLGTQTYLSNVL